MRGMDFGRGGGIDQKFSALLDLLVGGFCLFASPNVNM